MNKDIEIPQYIEMILVRRVANTNAAVDSLDDMMKKMNDHNMKYWHNKLLECEKEVLHVYNCYLSEIAKERRKSNK